MVRHQPNIKCIFIPCDKYSFGPTKSSAWIPGFYWKKKNDFLRIFQELLAIVTISFFLKMFIGFHLNFKFSFHQNLKWIRDKMISNIIKYFWIQCVQVDLIVTYCWNLWFLRNFIRNLLTFSLENLTAYLTRISSGFHPDFS